MIKYFTIWIKSKVDEKDLEDKPLEYLYLKKDDECRYYSSKLPVFFAWLWIVVSVYISVQGKYDSWEATNPVLVKIFPWVALLFMIRLIKLLNDLEKNNKITDSNLKVYNKIIQEKIEKEEHAKKEYEKKIANYLKEINEKLEK